MQTCSNCGAAARPGAKFCTSCGARLPIVPTSDSAGWAANGDQAPQPSPWGAAPTNGQSSAPAEPANVTASAGGDQPVSASDIVSGGTPSAWGQSSGDDQSERSDATGASTSGSSPSWTWGQAQADETTQDDTVSAAPPETSDDSAASNAPSNWISSWTGPASDTDARDETAASDTETAPAPPTNDASGWTAPASDTASTDTASSEPAASDTAETDEAIAGEQPEAQNGDPDARPEWMRNLASDTATAPDGPAPSGEDARSGDAAPAAPEPVAESDQPGAGAASSDATTADAGAKSQPADSIMVASASDDEGATLAGDGQTGGAVVSAPAAGEDTTATSAAMTGPSSDALAEAQGLLDRLRDLLPALAAPAAAAAPTVDTAGITDQLQQAVDQNAKAEFDDLRSVLEAAKERPRDVDTMLNLVAKIDPMLDLLHAHGNLLTTISTAVAQLRDQRNSQ